MQNCPDGARFAWAYKANALALLDRHQEAADAARKVPQTLVIQ